MKNELIYESDETSGKRVTFIAIERKSLFNFQNSNNFKKLVRNKEIKVNDDNKLPLKQGGVSSFHLIDFLEECSRIIVEIFSIVFHILEQ